MKTNYIGKKVIVRCDRAGVFFGTLKEKDGQEAIKEHGDWVKFDTYFDRIVGLAKNSVNTTSANMDYGTALNKYLFLDGTPFGKLEE